jgi:hypothetical protein
MAYSAPPAIFEAIANSLEKAVSILERIAACLEKQQSQASCGKSPLNLLPDNSYAAAAAKNQPRPLLETNEAPQTSRMPSVLPTLILGGVKNTEEVPHVLADFAGRRIEPIRAARIGNPNTTSLILVVLQNGIDQRDIFNGRHRSHYLTQLDGIYVRTDRNNPMVSSQPLVNIVQGNNRPSETDLVRKSPTTTANATRTKPVTECQISSSPNNKGKVSRSAFSSPPKKTRNEETTQEATCLQHAEEDMISPEKSRSRFETTNKYAILENSDELTCTELVDSPTLANDIGTEHSSSIEIQTQKAIETMTREFFARNEKRFNFLR